MRELWGIIWSNYGGWQYDDSNQSAFGNPSNITSGTATYTLPTGTLSIKGIEVKDSSGKWHPVVPITDEQIRSGVGNNVAGSGQFYSVNSGAVGDFLTTPGLPLYFQLVGSQVTFYPTPNWTQVQSIKFFFDRGSVAFLTTDTTKEPGFASEFHDLVPLGASVLWYSIYSPEDPTYIALGNKYEKRKADLARFYQMQSGRLFKKNLGVARQDNR